MENKSSDGWIDSSISVMQLNIGRLEVNCFDEDAEMSIKVGKSSYQSLSIGEAKELASFIVSHIKNETEVNTEPPPQKLNKTALGFVRSFFRDKKEVGDMIRPNDCIYKVRESDIVKLIHQFYVENNNDLTVYKQAYDIGYTDGFRDREELYIKEKTN